MTIFVALLLLAMLPLLSLLMQIAQKEAAETYFTYAAKSARENLKASYCREFFDRYDLYVVWENQKSAEERLLEVLEKYEDPAKGQAYYWALPIAFQNPSVDIYSYHMATDELGKYLQEQIVESEKERVALDAVFLALDQWKDYREGYDVFESIPEILENIESVPITDPSEEPATDESMEKETVLVQESMQSVTLLELLQLMKDQPILTVILGTEKVSDRVIPFSYGAMEESLEDRDYEKYPLELYEKYLVCSYLERHFGDFLQNDKDNTFLQLEYILSGRGSDQENMEKMIEKFVLWKGAINLMSALDNESMVRQAEELSTAVLAWLGNPALVEGGKILLLAAISYGEAIVDGRRILSGKEVALFKGQEDWMLTFENAADILSSPDSCMVNDKKGSSYSEYLKYLLLLEDPANIRIRMMEIMQWNMQQENPLFLLEHCVCGIQYEMQAQSARTWIPLSEKWREIIHRDTLMLGFS